jgi:FkbM family methyltransferase
MIMKLKYPEGDNSWKFRNGLEWDREHFETAQKKIKNYRTCLDLGGHIGITSIRFSKHFEQVHTFEPIHIDCFEHNTAELDNVTLYPYAVSDKTGTVDMFINTNNSGGCAVVHEGIIDYLYRKNQFVPTTSFPCRAVDEFDFQDVDFIKIDVEGYNLPVLDGMKNLLERCSPIMQIEIAADEAYNKRFYNKMKELGYTEFAQVGRIDKFYERV